MQYKVNKAIILGRLFKNSGGPYTVLFNYYPTVIYTTAL